MLLSRLAIEVAYERASLIRERNQLLSRLAIQSYAADGARLQPATHTQPRNLKPATHKESRNLSELVRTRLPRRHGNSERAPSAARRRAESGGARQAPPPAARRAPRVREGSSAAAASAVRESLPAARKARGEREGKRGGKRLAVVESDLSHGQSRASHGSRAQSGRKVLATSLEARARTHTRTHTHTLSR